MEECKKMRKTLWVKGNKEMKDETKEGGGGQENEADELEVKDNKDLKEEKELK